MDSGGLILNFADGDSVETQAGPKRGLTEIAASVKKGSWITRRKLAKKILHGMTRKEKKTQEQNPSSKPSTTATSSTTSPTAATAAKRADSKRGARNAESQPQQPAQSRKRPAISEASQQDLAEPASASAPAPAKRSRPNNPNGVISSLFSRANRSEDPDAPASSKNPANKAKSHSQDDDQNAAYTPIDAGPVFVDDETFSGLGLDIQICKHLNTKLDFHKPTLIQKASIPVLLTPPHNDAILQAQTGSGKSLAFLLPIVHSLVRSAAALQSNASPQIKGMFSRSAGTFAIILAPTRELAHQISDVVDSLLKYSLQDAPTTLATQSKQNPVELHYRHWIVSGIIVGGESRKSEKARLRKGVNILVCTPGRLLDHLKSTDAFDVSNLRWLVLDEADNLMHLGFEETLKDILKLLDAKCEQGLQTGTRVQIPGWPRDRQTVLCSATIESGVKKLAEHALVEPRFISARYGKVMVHNEIPASLVVDRLRPKPESTDPSDHVTIPKQLKQSYIVAPPKLRLVTLIALLRRITPPERGSKVIVFCATGDSVDWHFDALSHALDHNVAADAGNDSDNETNNTLDLKQLKAGIRCNSLFPAVRLYKLHGSLPQPQRQATFAGFCAASADLDDGNSAPNSILFCTDVAARGLDLPDVTHIVQYDPPSDVRDYIHRIGRTARKQSRKTFEVVATDLHMAFERYVLASPTNKQLAQKAFTSQVRAYATHASSERHIFHIKNLHLGHLAKSFALREAPTGVAAQLGREMFTKGHAGKKDSKPASVAGLMKRKAFAMASNGMSEFADGDIVTLMKKQK
eukprot:jgi/Hompol1/1563/HPOL_001735-RA